MQRSERRRFLGAAAAIGASSAFGGALAAPARKAWRERRDLYPEGVASGDPAPDSVLLWTRRPPRTPGETPRLTVEVAEDEGVHHLVARAPTRLSAEADWTCRVLVGGLKPDRVYWYRFTDQTCAGSRVGRTRTGPPDDADRQARFVFISCQNADQGAQTAYRRMIFDDVHAPPERQLDFVLPLGDFIYEIVWYPPDRPQGMYDRRLRDNLRYAHGQKVADFRIPTTLDDCRSVYRAYLADPDLQDARARWPFVGMWDNHEFSWKGWQSFQRFQGDPFPA